MQPLVKHPLVYFIAFVCLAFGYLINAYAGNQSGRLCDLEKQVRNIELSVSKISDHIKTYDPVTTATQQAVMQGKMEFALDEIRKMNSKLDKLLERRDADGYIRNPQDSGL